MQLERISDVAGGLCRQGRQGRGVSEGGRYMFRKLEEVCYTERTDSSE